MDFGTNEFFHRSDCVVGLILNNMPLCVLIAEESCLMHPYLYLLHLLRLTHMKKPRLERQALLMRQLHLL